MSIIIGAIAFALTFWGSIKLLDRYNTQNTLPVAGIIGLVFSACAPGSIFILLPLVALLYLLVSFYDLGIVRSFGVVASMMLMNLGLAELLARLQLAM